MTSFLRLVAVVALALPATLAPRGSAAAEVLVEASAAPLSPFVGQQVILEVRALRPPEALHGQLSEPTLADAHISLLGSVEVYTESRGGVEYTVLHKRYAIVPGTAGTMEIAGLVFRPTVTDASQYSDDPTLAIDGAANTAAPPKAVRLDVRAPEATGPAWLPATGLVLEDSWSRPPSSLAVGDAVTRTIRVVANGVAATALPPVVIPEQPGYILHADQPELHTDYRGEGMHAVRTQRFVLLVTAATELPRIEVPWYDLGTGESRTARIAAVALTADAPRSSDPTRSVAPPATSPRSSAPWVAVAVVLAAVLAALGFKRRHLRRARADVRRACRANDREAARLALSRYARLRWPIRPPLNLLEMGERLGGGAEAALHRLDRESFGAATDGPWDGAGCWRAVAAALRPGALGLRKRRPEVRPGVADALRTGVA